MPAIAYGHLTAWLGLLGVSKGVAGGRDTLWRCEGLRVGIIGIPCILTPKGGIQGF